MRHPAPVADRPLRPEDLDDPVAGPGQILVEIHACAICRTDLHVVEGELPTLRSPLVPGHQVVGRVAGRGRDATRFREGDRVGIAWLRRTCGRCLYCATDRENLCERAEFTGWHADGGYAEYAVVDEEYAYAIPADFSDVEAAPLLCAGIIGYRALKLAAVRPGGRLGMYGFGSSAHVTIQLARGRNMEVYVCTREPAHRELAQSLGAAWVGDVHEPMPHRADGTILFAPAGELVPVALAQPGAGRNAGAGRHLHDADPATRLRGRALLRARGAIGDRQYASRRRRAPRRSRPDPGAAGHHRIPAGRRQPGPGAAQAGRDLGLGRSIDRRAFPGMIAPPFG